MRDWALGKFSLPLWLKILLFTGLAITMALLLHKVWISYQRSSLSSNNCFSKTPARGVYDTLQRPYMQMRRLNATDTRNSPVIQHIYPTLGDGIPGSVTAAHVEHSDRRNWNPLQLQLALPPTVSEGRILPRHQECEISIVKIEEEARTEAKQEDSRPVYITVNHYKSTVNRYKSNK